MRLLCVRFMNCLVGCVVACAGVQTLAAAVSDQTPTVHIVNDASTAPMKIFVGIVDSDLSECQEFVRDVNRCLTFGKRLEVTVDYGCALPHKKRAFKKFLRALFQQGYDCALFLTYNRVAREAEWRLYQVVTDDMVVGKKVVVQDSASLDTIGCLVAAQIIRELLGSTFPVASKIAYRVKRKNKSGVCYELVTADFDGAHASTVFSTPIIFVAPCWGGDAQYPCIFYSEFTPTNVRLMVSDMHGRRHPLLHYLDGTTVGVSFAPWSQDVPDRVVYCRSGTIWEYSFDAERKRGIHRLLIKESMPAACPALTSAGDIYYCCRGKLKCWEAATKKKKVITPDGYCVAPAYCASNQKVVYSKRVNGLMQLFVYDTIDGSHKQITFDSNRAGHEDHRSNKIDPCWSPCGSYCAFCWEKAGKSRIAVLDVETGVYQFITLDDEECSYPSWSGKLV